MTTTANIRMAVIRLATVTRIRVVVATTMECKAIHIQDRRIMEVCTTMVQAGCRDTRQSQTTQLTAALTTTTIRDKATGHKTRCI